MQAAGAGAATFNGGAGGISLTEDNDFTGPVTLNNSGANNAAIADANDLVLTAQSIAQLLDITAAGSVTQSGAFTGAGGVTFHGTGTLTLSATNTYAGTTLVRGGTLNGAGSITGPLQINSSATLAPGTSPGIFSSGNAAFASGSIFNIEINGTTAGTGFDQLAVTGSVNLGGATVSESLPSKSPKPKSAPAPTHSKRERRKPSPPLRHCSVPPDCRLTSSSAKHCCKLRR